MTEPLTYETLNAPNLLDVVNSVRWGWDEETALKPEIESVDSSWKIISAIEAINLSSKRGCIYLGNGIWRISQNVLDAGAKRLDIIGGPETVLELDEGVTGLVLSGDPLGNSQYHIWNLTIMYGLTAIQTLDPVPDHSRNGCAWHSSFGNLYLLNQSAEGLHFQNGLYHSALTNCIVEGQGTTRPAHAIYVDNHFGAHNISLDLCNFRGTQTAAIANNPALPGAIEAATISDTCLENNQGQVASLTNCKEATFARGHWELNVKEDTGTPRPIAEFTDCANIEIKGPHHSDTNGAGAQDPSDGNKVTVVKATGCTGTVYEGRPVGYIDLDGHRVWSADHIRIDTRPQYVTGPDGTIYQMVPGAAFVPVA